MYSYSNRILSHAVIIIIVCTKFSVLLFIICFIIDSGIANLYSQLVKSIVIILFVFMLVYEKLIFIGCKEDIMELSQLLFLVPPLILPFMHIIVLIVFLMYSTIGML